MRAKKKTKLKETHADIQGGVQGEFDNECVSRRRQEEVVN